MGMFGTLVLQVADIIRIMTTEGMGPRLRGDDAVRVIRSPHERSDMWATLAIQP
jgi:hypothetical protein